MTYLFNEILYRPIFNILVVIYNLLPGHDFGIAIIILTLFIRILFLPLSFKSIRSQRELAQLQPKLKELQDKHKHDRQALGQATMDLYKEHNVNPFGGCLPLIIQIPILFALYKALRTGLDPKSLASLYGFVHNPVTINSIAFGFLDLTKHIPVMAVIAGALQALQSRIALKNQQAGLSKPQDSMAVAMNAQMLYFFPIMIIIISWNLPAGIVIYWVAATLFSIFEQLWIKKTIKI